MWEILMVLSFIAIRFCLSGPPQSSFMDPSLFYVPVLSRDGRKCDAAIPGRKLPPCEIVLKDPNDISGDKESRLMCFALYDALYQLCHLKIKFINISTPDGPQFCNELPSVLTLIHHYTKYFRGWTELVKTVLSDSEKCNKLCLTDNKSVNETCQWIWSAHFILKNKDTFLRAPKTTDLTVTKSQSLDPPHFETPKIPSSSHESVIKNHTNPQPNFDSGENYSTNRMTQTMFSYILKTYLSNPTVRRNLPGSKEAGQSLNISEPQPPQDASGFRDGVQIRENKRDLMPDEANERRGSGLPAVRKWYTNVYFWGLLVVVVLLFLVGVFVFVCVMKARPAATDTSLCQSVYSSEIIENEKLLKIIIENY